MEALREPSRSRYKILQQIGEGSMGAVYLARDLENDREVALKTIADAESLSAGGLDHVRRLFAIEASASALLDHPGVVRVFDLIEEPQGATYLVMEYVAGTSLDQILARPTPIPFEFVVKTITRVAEVLEHAHEQGVVHRDIKPANILVSDGGEIKVADFGLAELRGEDLGSDLQRAGSPSYMAPERVLGTGSDHRGDIWALGVVLYEMVARRLPFQGEAVAELITKVAAEEPPPLDADGMSVVPGLQPIVDKALAKEPDERYLSAAELVEELEMIQVGQLSLSATLPASAIPDVSPLLQDPDLEFALPASPEQSDLSVPPPPEASQPSRRGLWAAIAVATNILALLTLGVAAQIPLEPPTPPVVSEASPDGAAELQRQRLEYLSLLEEARGLLDRGETEAAAALFARAEGMSPDARRIRALRDQARRQAQVEVAREIEIEVATLVGIAETDLEDGALTDAADAVQRALELDSDHPEALTLEIAIEHARQAVERRNRRRQPERVKPVQQPVAPPIRQPEPMRIEQPIRPPAAAPAPTYSDLKVDFYSDLARGVVTVYMAESQVLRRSFRYLERKGFMRSKEISGGFDEQVRVPAGPTDLRVYLSLPGRETQVARLSGILPPGAIRALQVRVSAAGTLSVELH